MKMTVKTLSLVAMAAAVAACSKNPEEIAPAPISPTLYKHLSCKELEWDLDQATDRAERANVVQRKDAENDNARVAGSFLVGGWLLFFNNANENATDVALFKGQVEAISTAGREKGCW